MSSKTRKTRDSLTIGVLDIQGSVEEHLVSLRAIGVQAIAVKKPQQINEIDGLILPGGESTTIGKLLTESGIFDAIKKRKTPLPMWGTCAGAILLAKKIQQPMFRGKPSSLKLLNATIERNAYGNQLESFETELTIDEPTFAGKPLPAVFIRAPRIGRTHRSIKILARHEGAPVMLQQGNLLATTFHPELTSDTRVHQFFASICRNSRKNSLSNSSKR